MRFRWLTVDLPRVVELRRRLLSESSRVSSGGRSALDYRWMDRAETGDGVFITAEVHHR
jgi:O-methyltransferase involved in polyketide biosynthesis